MCDQHIAWLPRFCTPRVTSWSAALLYRHRHDYPTTLCIALLFIIPGPLDPQSATRALLHLPFNWVGTHQPPRTLRSLQPLCTLFHIRLSSHSTPANPHVGRLQWATLLALLPSSSGRRMAPLFVSSQPLLLATLLALLGKAALQQPRLSAKQLAHRVHEDPGS